MKIEDEDMKEFQRLYKEHFGEELTREEAYEKAIRLLNFIKVVVLGKINGNAQKPE